MSNPVTDMAIKLASDVISPTFDDSAIPKEAALKALESASAPGSLHLSAVRRLFGPQVLAWEPESLWLSLSMDFKLDPSETVRNKIMAASTLVQNPAFYWDMHVFEDTCLAFNSEPVIINVLQESSPAQLSWGVYEAEILARRHGMDPEFDHDPAHYTAASLYRSGFVLAPEMLVFAQEELNKLFVDNGKAKDSTLLSLCRQIKSVWTSTDKSDLENLVLKETPIDVQIGRLAAVHLYIEQQLKNYAEWLKKFQPKD